MFLDKNKIGLTLGGGGARGFAHLGVHKRLEELEIKPDIISGTSAGAVMGAFIADGKPSDEIFEILTQKNLFEYTKFRFFSDGFIRLEGIKDDIRKHISVKNLEDLKTPLIICASNLNSGEVHYFEKGDLFEAVIASASIPILFTPMEIDNVKYVDGGMFDNLPVQILKEKTDVTIGVNISPIQYEKDIEGFRGIAARTFQLSTHSNTRSSRKMCDILIEPKELNQYHILEIDKAKEMFDIGYKAAKNTNFDKVK